MLYKEVVSELGEDAEQLEQLYRSALKAGEGDAFGQAIAAGHAAEPNNLLYAAWYHRLKMTVEEVRASFVNWAWVVPLAVYEVYRVANRRELPQPAAVIANRKVLGEIARGD